jgi:hypothetical protein
MRTNLESVNKPALARAGSKLYADYNKLFAILCVAGMTIILSFVLLDLTLLLRSLPGTGERIRSAEAQRNIF